MRSVAARRFPTLWIIIFAFLGIAASVAIGRVIAIQYSGIAP